MDVDDTFPATSSLRPMASMRASYCVRCGWESVSLDGAWDEGGG